MQILDRDANHPQWSLASSKLLAALPDNVICDLEEACVWCRCEPEEMILSADEQLDSVFFIIEGAVRIFHRIGDKREVNFAQFGPGDTLGELSAIDGKGRKADVVTVDEAVIAICERQVFRNMLLAHPTIAMRLLERLSAIIRSADERIASLATMSGAQRVYMELLRLATPNTEQPGTFIIAPAPYHRDIAAWAGTTTDVVARAIGNLMKADLLHRHGPSLILLDIERIGALVQSMDGSD